MIKRLTVLVCAAVIHAFHCSVFPFLMYFFFKDLIMKQEQDDVKRKKQHKKGLLQIKYMIVKNKKAEKVK